MMMIMRPFAGNAAMQRTCPVDTLRSIASLARHPLLSIRWIYFIACHPVAGALAKKPSALLAKALRPYLSALLNPPARLRLLMRHYAIVHEAGFGRLTKQAAMHPQRICSIAGKSGRRYWLELSTAGDERRAGEWVLRLVSQNMCIYTITFLFTTSQGERHLVVGSLTGMLAMGRRTGIRQATWDFHGWRPKEIMVSVAREIGAALDCKKMVLIGNRNKLPVTAMRFCRKSADYDRTWTELNAQPRTDGDFELPCMPAAAASGVRSQSAKTKRDALIESVHCRARMRLDDLRTRMAAPVPFGRSQMERKSA